MSVLNYFGLFALIMCGVSIVDSQFCAQSKITFKQHYAHANLDSAIELTWSVEFSSFSEDWFIKTCLDHLLLRVSDINSVDVHVDEQAAYYNKVTRGFQRIDNLIPVTSYKIEFIFKNGLDELTLKTFKASTCFSNPSSPRDIQSQVMSDSKSKYLVISWLEPEIFKAPKICYYEISFRSIAPIKVENQVYEVRDLSLIEKAGGNILVRAVNANKFKGDDCYRNLSPRCNYTSISKNWARFTIPKDQLDDLSLEVSGITEPFNTVLPNDTTDSPDDSNSDGSGWGTFIRWLIIIGAIMLILILLVILFGIIVCLRAKKSRRMEPSK